jgi:hypothetical protein
MGSAIAFSSFGAKSCMMSALGLNVKAGKLSGLGFREGIRRCLVGEPGTLGESNGEAPGKLGGSETEAMMVVRVDSTRSSLSLEF